MTDWRVVAREAGATRLELRPLTGRSHQLRVHLAAIGHPILGDPFYGDAGGGGRGCSCMRRGSGSGIRTAGPGSSSPRRCRSDGATGRCAVRVTGRVQGVWLPRLDPGRGAAARAARLGAQRAGRVGDGAAGRAGGGGRRGWSGRCGGGRRTPRWPASETQPAEDEGSTAVRGQAAGCLALEPGGAADAGAVAVDVLDQAGVEPVAEDMRSDQRRARSRRGGRRWRGRRRGR